MISFLINWFRKLKKLWKKDTTFIFSFGCGKSYVIGLSWFRCYLIASLFLLFSFAVYFSSASYKPVTRTILKPNDSNEVYEKINAYRNNFNEIIDEQERFCYVIEHRPKGKPCGNLITSNFGWRRRPIFGGTHFHKGIDLPCPIGTPIRTAGSGKIKFAGKKLSYGNCVFIDHGYKIETRYGHCSKLNCKEGDEVKENQVIGFVGSSGWSVAPHLHYEIRVGGRPVNPKQYIIKEE